jgi:ribosomal protein S12 methylthiotransferase accessory factor
MLIKIRDSIKSCSKYPDKLFHPRKTIKIGLIALRKLKPPFLVSSKRLDYVDRLNIPVYTCKTNKIAEELYLADWTFGHQSHGKGKSLIQSKASALMELLERFSCYAFLKNHDNFVITTCGRVKNKMVQKILLQSLPKRYKKDTFIYDELKKVFFKWARSFSLTRNKDILFPIHWFATVSTGFASGNCIEEAILQGLCEVIERHLISIITEKKIITPLIDVDSIDNNEAKSIISKFNHAGIKLFIKDFSCGFEITTIGILAYDSKGAKSVKIYCAAGTSLNKDIALIRALTEIAQHRAQTLFKKTTRSATYGFPFYKNLKDAEYLINSEKVINFSNLSTYSNKNFKVEIETVVKILKNKGLEIIVTDVTHPVIKISTVIITIPGLQIAPTPNNPYLELAKHYIEVNNYYKSINILKNFLKFYATQKNKEELLLPYLLLGSCYEQIKRNDNALELYKKTLKIFPSESAIYLGLGRVYFYLKKYRQAIKNIRRALKLNYQGSGAYSILGFCYENLENYTQAIKALRKEEKINPKDRSVNLALARCYRDLGKTALFEKEINKSIPINIHVLNHIC